MSGSAAPAAAAGSGGADGPLFDTARVRSPQPGPVPTPGQLDDEHRCQVAVLGAGSWGTAFSLILADAGASSLLWARSADRRDDINRRRVNHRYLPDIVLSERIKASTDVGTVLDGADVVVLAVPSQTLRENLSQWAHLIPEQAILVSLMKGIELGTCQRMSQVIAEVTGASADRIAVLSGPNLAREIAVRQPSASVIACPDTEVALHLGKLTSTPYFRTYYTHDVTGVELGGAVKNVIALAVGMTEGMGWGDNTQASIITRGLAEMSRLGQALGADARTFSGLAGMGDLVATCSSELSRNRSFGVALGRGYTLAQIMKRTSQIAEGVKTCQSVLELARRAHVPVPITEKVVEVVHHGAAPNTMMTELLSAMETVEHETA